MTCGMRNERWTVIASTLGSDSTTLFLPASAPLAVSDLDQVAITQEVVSRTANLEVRPAIRFSQDGLSWADERGLGAWASATGTTHAPPTSVPATRGAWAQIGLQARNTSGTSDAAKGVVQLEATFRHP